MNVGLYFGSFNPIHMGHLVIASHILNETALQKVWFVVSPQNPFKKSATLLNEFDRLHLVQLAIEGDDRLKAVDIEFALPKPSYTATTLTYLAEKHPSHQFEIIMGSDSFQNLASWHNPRFIIKNYRINVYNRPGFAVKDTLGAQVNIMNAPLLEISATHIRQLVKSGKSIKYLVPHKVEKEIIENRLFSKL
ncbi:MAG: nicotinate (nicotinamide) nucleotide adenylyltransferase [Chitinophagaceae bacterium]